MKKIFFTLTLLYVTFGFGQNDSINKSQKAMKTFNEAYYKNLKADDKYRQSSSDQFYVDGEDHIRVTIYKGLNITSVKRWIRNTNRIEAQEYDLSTKLLIKEGQIFSQTPYGIWREYDNKGSIIKENDWDIDFSFSIEDLIKKMKDEYHIDILDRYLISVHRSNKNNKYNMPYYKVTKGAEQGIDYIIDGENGRTITTIYFPREYEKDSEKVIENALRSYKKN